LNSSAKRAFAMVVSHMLQSKVYECPSDQSNSNHNEGGDGRRHYVQPRAIFDLTRELALEELAETGPSRGVYIYSSNYNLVWSWFLVL
jgi:hypothetical protein